MCPGSLSCLRWLATTSYATPEGIDAVGEAVIKASNITTVVTNRKNEERVASLKKALPRSGRSFTHGVPRPAGGPRETNRCAQGLTALSLQHCFLFGPRASRRPTPDQVAVIMYTSGSTGKPKGVLLKRAQKACWRPSPGCWTSSARPRRRATATWGISRSRTFWSSARNSRASALGAHRPYADPRSR